MSTQPVATRSGASSVVSLAIAGALSGLLLGCIDTTWTGYSGYAAGLDASGVAALFGTASLLAAGVGGLLGAGLGGVAALLSRIPFKLPRRFVVGGGLSAAFFLAFLVVRMEVVFPYVWPLPIFGLSPDPADLVASALPWVLVCGVLPFLLTRKTDTRGPWWLAWCVLVALGAAFIEVGVYATSRHGAVAYIHVAVLLGTLSVTTVGVHALIREHLGSSALGARSMTAGVLLAALGLCALTPAALATGGRHSLKSVAFNRTAMTHRLLWLMPHFEPMSRRATARQLRALGVDDACSVEEPVDNTAAMPAAPVRGVVVVVVDTLRADRLGATRNGVPLTPRLDAFAKRARVFDNAYATTPKTWHSLGAALTGRAPGLADVPLESVHDHMIVDKLQKFGVYTLAVPTHKYVRHLVADFDHLELEAYQHRRQSDDAPAQRTTEVALATLDELADQHRFFALFHYFDPHAPYERHEGFDFGESMEARYDAEVAHTDAWVGELLDGIDEKFGEGVTVIVMSDHGEEFWDHGYRYHSLRLYDESTRLVMMMRVPGQRDSARTTRAVSTADIAPTVLEMFGLTPTESMEGKTLTASVEEPPPLFLMNARKSSVGTLDGSSKLIVDRPTGIIELYDIEADPAEQHNLADEHPERVAELYCKLSAMMRKKGQAIDEAPFSINEPSLKGHQIRGADRSR